jgi:hypothetical protein
MVFARSEAAHRALNVVFADRRVSKIVSRSSRACLRRIGPRDRPLTALGAAVREANPGDEQFVRDALGDFLLVDDGAEIGLPGRACRFCGLSRNRTSSSTGGARHLAGPGSPIVGDATYASPSVASAWPRLCSMLSRYGFNTRRPESPWNWRFHPR